MRFVISSRLLSVFAVVALFVAGCGASGSNNAGNGGLYGGGNSPTATTAPTTSGATLTTASVSVSGTMETVLVDATGLTLYYRTSDTATSVFSGAAWPPLLASNGTPTSGTTLPGQLAVLNDANGAQVTYNGHPLYTFANDTAPGQATGDGVGGVWYVATPSLAAKTGGAPGTPTGTPTPCTGYYCHY